GRRRPVALAGPGPPGADRVGGRRDRQPLLARRRRRGRDHRRGGRRRLGGRQIVASTHRPGRRPGVRGYGPGDRRGSTGGTHRRGGRRDRAGGTGAGRSVRGRVVVGRLVGLDPVVAAFHGPVPLPEQVRATLGGHLRGPAAALAPQAAQRIDVGPHAHGQTGRIGGAERGGLGDLRAHHR